MNKSFRLIMLAALAGAASTAHAGAAASDCSAGLHLGHAAQTAAANPATAGARVAEYLEFHARAAEANGRRPPTSWPAAPAASN